MDADIRGECNDDGDMGGFVVEADEYKEKEVEKVEEKGLPPTQYVISVETDKEVDFSSLYSDQTRQSLIIKRIMELPNGHVPYGFAPRYVLFLTKKNGNLTFLKEFVDKIELLPECRDSVITASFCGSEAQEPFSFVTHAPHF